MKRRTRQQPPAGSLAEQVVFMRRANREAFVADLRDGRVRRAHTFTDRRKEASRRACRERVSSWE